MMDTKGSPSVESEQQVWFPGINDAIKTRIANCQHCQESHPSLRNEPLITTELPDRPFQKVGADLLHFLKKDYIVVMDYYSRYLDIAHLPSISTAAVTGRLKSIFSHHGVPELVFTDNGSQLVSKEYRSFAED